MTVSQFRLRRASTHLHRGGVLAYPTEAVFGLGCDPFDEAAVYEILRLKQRPVSKGLILVASSVDQVAFLLEGMSTDRRDAILARWPGHTTWLIPHRNRIPYWVHGTHDTVAVRVSSHPGVQALCARYGGALISTSANPAGLAPARSALAVRRYFGHATPEILPGDLGKEAQPSTIIHAESGKLLR